jgi:hypothetical protein
MAQETEFDHDELGHLLADHLLRVPRFQRSYSWDKSNVEEFLSDLAEARRKGVSYFMGTVVFASPSDGDERRQIVDGQQRLATTAIMIIAIRDLLHEYAKHEQAKKTTERYLQGYVLAEESTVERLILSPRDQETYDALLESRFDDILDGDPIYTCYEVCRDHLLLIAPKASMYKELLGVIGQLEKEVQVLVAVASDLPEAYVIFETLNDRGADLTTADLLKNFLFSQAKSHFDYVESKWTGLEANFERADELVKFIRHEHISRHGSITTRKLYRAIQSDIRSQGKAKDYVGGLAKAQLIYSALKDPDHSYWNELSFDVKDALLAYRRFGFESSLPVLIAAFRTWKKPAAAKLLVKMAKWSVRAQFTGRIGGSLSEETFGEAARAISSGEVTNQTGVRKILAPLIATNTEFKNAFVAYGPVSVARAKYLLAMLEKVAPGNEQGQAQAIDWSSKAVTIEHVMAKASTKSDADLALVDTVGNLALLEKKINHDLGHKPFTKKKASYTQSVFRLTVTLAEQDAWTNADIEKRTKALGELACTAWPAT